MSIGPSNGEVDTDLRFRSASWISNRAPSRHPVEVELARIFAS
jgi:hypothetical protein